MDHSSLFPQLAGKAMSSTVISLRYNGGMEAVYKLDMFSMLPIFDRPGCCFYIVLARLGCFRCMFLFNTPVCWLINYFRPCSLTY